MKYLFLLIVLVGITFLSCSDNQESTLVSSHSKTDLPLPGQLYAGKLINGETGDELILNRTCIDSTGREIIVYARLRVLENSFPGSKTISIIPNIEEEFSQPVHGDKFDRNWSTSRLPVWRQIKFPSSSNRRKVGVIEKS